MKLQQKPNTIEAVLWTGATFSEWPEWIKAALLKKPKEAGRIHREDEQTLYLTTSRDLVLIPPGFYLAYHCNSDTIYLDTFNRLSKQYDRLTASGQPVELKQIDAACMQEVDDLEDDDEPAYSKPAPKKVLR